MTVEMIDTLINGEWTLKLPEHRAHRAEWRDGWEKERWASIAANVNPGDLVIDVGAEEGDLSALFPLWGCDTILIEPNPLVWPNIRAIFEGNDLPHPLATVVGFAGNEERHSADWDNRYVWPASEATGWWPHCAFGPLIADHGFLNLCERPDVPIVKIDDLAVRIAPPNAITVDVEGAELEVMRGAENVLREHRPLVWISVHPEFGFNMYGTYESDLHGFMHSCGYVKRWLAHDHEHHLLYAPDERAADVVLQERADWT